MSETIFNVVDYGAVSDGETDCTKFIQRALDDAADCRGTVIVPPGIYSVGRLTMKGQGVSLVGSSSWSYRSPGASVFELNSSNVDCMIDITGAFGCSIRGMSLTGGHRKNNNSPIHGIKLYWDEYNGGSEEDTPSIDDCQVTHFSGDGVHLEHIWCFSVRHSMLAYNDRNGLFIDGWDGFVLDNWFSYNKGYGLKGGNVVASITATGNRVEWNEKGGFRIPYGDSYNFTGNFFDRGHGPAIDLGGISSVSLVSITGNIFRRSGASDSDERYDEYSSCHMRLTNCSNITAIGNTMRVGRNDGGGGVLSPDYAMVIQACNGCIIKNNTMIDAALKELIVAERNTDCLIEENIGRLTSASWSTGSKLLN